MEGARWLGGQGKFLLLIDDYYGYTDKGEVIDRI